MNSDPATAKAWSPRAFRGLLTSAWEANDFSQDHFSRLELTSEEALCHLNS
jgi:hypothetical protein